MPRRLAWPCPLPLYSLSAYAVMHWYVLGPREITFAKGRGAELYDSAVSGTAVPAPPPPLSVECRMLRRLAWPCPLPLYSLSAYAVMHWHVLGPREITCAKGRGAELYDSAVSGTAVPTLPLLSTATRCCARVRPLCRIHA